MSKILLLDKSYELYITYSWYTGNHGICGHTFEAIEYYLLLKNYFKVGILLAEDITWNTFKNAIVNKYDLTENELQEIKNNTIFNNRPMVIKGTNILFTDGGIVNLENVKLYMNNVFMFACGNKKIKDNYRDNWYILQDNRVYDKVLKNGIDYKKKILFSKFKSIGKSEDNIMLYGTKNCRNIPVAMYTDLLSTYSKNFICLTNDNNKVNVDERMQFVSMPVKNLFELFSTYVYTPIPRKFDCSPRFIAECKFYNKDVLFYNIDYFKEDLGLYWRKHDIENDFESLFLTDQDDVINILKDIIKG